MSERHRIPLLKRFFEGLVQHAFFERLGVPDPRLTDYLTDLLCRFVRMDAVFRMRDVRGRRLEEVAEMLATSPAGEATDDRRRAIHKHIGDFVLFWTGVYPEFLRRLRAPASKDSFVDYVRQGRRSYYIASTFDRRPFEREARVLRRLSSEFELCTYGLSLVRRGWESLSPGSYSDFRKRW